MASEQAHHRTSAIDESIFGKFFLSGTSKIGIWLFFNPSKRTWEFLKIQKESFGAYPHSIIIRNGWIIKKVEKRRPAYYYLAKNNEMKSIGYAQALTEIRKFSVQEIELRVTTERGIMKIDLNEIFLPPEQFKNIVKTPDTTIQENRFFCFPLKSFTQIESLFKENGIKLYIQNIIEEHEQKVDNVQKKASHLLNLLYGKYLKNESKIEELVISLLSRKTDDLNDQEVQKELYFITKDIQNDEEEMLTSFLADVATTYFDWKFIERFNLNPSILGLLIGATPQEYQGHWTWNYLKVILPYFETVVYLQTRISPYGQGIGKMHPLTARLGRILLKKWRLYPYLGKLKNTGASKDVFFEESDRIFTERSFRTIIGIPTIEKALSQMCFLGSFNLDLEEWHGSYNLSRYFLAYVRIIEPLDPYSKTPCTIVEDFFGNKFRINWDFKTYLHREDEIHKLEKNGYISILIKNFLDTEYLHREQIDFQTIFGISFKFINKSNFFSRNILALIKYVGYTEIKLLKSLLTLFPFLNVDEIIAELEKTDQILVRDFKCYYIYNALAKQDYSYLLELMNNPETLPPEEFFYSKWYVLWSLLRQNLPKIHPLTYSTNFYEYSSKIDLRHMNSILDFATKTKDLHKRLIAERSQKRANFLLNAKKIGPDFQETFIGKKDDKKYLEHSMRMFRQFGQASIKARGKWILKAHYVAKYISRLFSYMEPSITRSDKIEKDPSGRDVREVEFYVEAFKTK